MLDGMLEIKRDEMRGRGDDLRDGYFRETWIYALGDLVKRYL